MHQTSRVCLDSLSSLEGHVRLRSEQHDAFAVERASLENRINALTVRCTVLEQALSATSPSPLLQHQASLLPLPRQLDPPPLHASASHRSIAPTLPLARSASLRESEDLHGDRAPTPPSIQLPIRVTPSPGQEVPASPPCDDRGGIAPVGLSSSDESATSLAARAPPPSDTLSLTARLEESAQSLQLPPESPSSDSKTSSDAPIGHPPKERVRSDDHAKPTTTMAPLRTSMAARPPLGTAIALALHRTPSPDTRPLTPTVHQRGPAVSVAVASLAPSSTVPRLLGPLLKPQPVRRLAS